MIDSYILKNSLPAMNNYELFAVIGMIQQELCDRHMKNHDNRKRNRGGEVGYYGATIILVYRVRN